MERSNIDMNVKIDLISFSTGKCAGSITFDLNDNHNTCLALSYLRQALESRYDLCFAD